MGLDGRFSNPRIDYDRAWFRLPVPRHFIVCLYAFTAMVKVPSLPSNCFNNLWVEFCFQQKSVTYQYSELRLL